MSLERKSTVAMDGESDGNEKDENVHNGQ